MTDGNGGWRLVGGGRVRVGWRGERSDDKGVGGQ